MNLLRRKRHDNQPCLIRRPCNNISRASSSVDCDTGNSDEEKVMPRIKYVHAHKKEPERSTLYVKPPDYTLDLFKRYQKAIGMKDKQLAEIIGCKCEQSIWNKRQIGTNRWKKQDLFQWAAALKVPMAELYEAMEMDARKMGYQI